MAQSFKINKQAKTNNDTGFGTQASSVGGRFINKDGSFNVQKKGLPFLRRISFYSYLLEFSWPKFFAIILLFFLLVNLAFTGLYLLNGVDDLTGFYSTTHWGRIRELFYFSTQTFTTVGYGRINPVGDVADVIATVEAMCGWLFFALVTGLLYGRFTRPRAYVAFSEKALVSPFGSGTAVMFRMVPYKTLHHLTEVRVVVSLSLQVEEEGKKPEYRFYTLALERSRVEMFNMNWTVVHPITEDSPLTHFTKEDLAHSDAELYVQVSGFDPLFSSTVLARTSYTYKEFVWGARFQPMYRESADDTTTILELNKLNLFEKAELPEVQAAATASKQ